MYKHVIFVHFEAANVFLSYQRIILYEKKAQKWALVFMACAEKNHWCFLHFQLHEDRGT